MRRRAIVVAACLVLAPVAAKAADLVVWWNEGWYAQEDEAVREIIAAFEEETGKEVELVLQPEDEMRDKAEAALELGQPPDFLWAPLSFFWVAEWAYEGRLVDLEDALNPYLNLFDADAIDVSTLLNGRTGKRGLYALPMGRGSNHIHVWNSLLERAGFTLADIPDQWDAFWSFWCDDVQPAIRRVMGRDDIWGVGLPMSSTAIDTLDQVIQFQLAYDASWFDHDRQLQIDDSATREGMVKALVAYTAIWRKGCTPPDAPTWTNYGNNKAFLEQMVVMTPNPTLSVPGGLREKSPEDYYENAVTIDWPNAVNGEPLVIEGTIQRAVVLKDGENTELAKDFVRFLVEDGWLAHWLNFAGDRYLPPMRKLVEQPFWLDPSDPHRMRAAVQTLTRSHLPQLGVRDNEWRSVGVYQENVWGNAVQRVVTEGISPEQAVDEAIARIKQILSE